MDKKLFSKSYLKLKEIRQKITNRTYNFIDTFENYTTIISLIISRVAYNSDLIKNRSINNRLYRYSSVLLFKESLGQEQAILNGLFLGSKLKKELSTYLTIIKAQKSIYRRIFLRTLPTKLKKQYIDDIQSIDIKSYEDKASKILSSDNIDVDANLWFKTITKKINIIQKIDQKILEDIVLEINKNKSKQLNYTKEEKDWLQKNQIIKLAIMNYWESDDKNNNIHTDLIKLLNKYGGINLTPVRYDAWADGYNAAIKGDDIYGIMNLSWNKQREEKYFNYTKIYKYTPNYLIVRADNKDINSLEDLKNKTIFLKKSAITHEVVKKLLNKPKVIDLKTDDEMYLQLSKNKKVDGFISYAVNENMLKKYNLKIAKRLYDKTGEVAIGVNKKYIHLASIINKIYKIIPKETLDELKNKTYLKTDKNINKQKVDVSFVKLMSIEELLFSLFIFALIAYGGLMFYKKINILHIKLRTFNILLVLFEFAVIFFLVYEIIILDRTEHKLASIQKDKFNMIQAADKLRQSSDDLTHFARTYAVTNNSKFKTQYLDTLAIRNGTKPRPYEYNGIYWELPKEIREKKHPLKEKLSLKDIISKLPFTKLEIDKLALSENNSNDLVNLELKAFEAIKNGDNELAIELLHSQDYYKAKHKIMLPIDDMLTMLNKRTNNTITILDKQIENQFQYILIVSLLFVLGNIIIYILLRKKINQPVEYLTNAIKAFQNGENDIQRETFFNDEIGDMNRDFFKMKEHINMQSLEILEEKKKIENIHQHTRESIQYAALIQSAVLPNNDNMRKYFKDQFVIWHPKDTVGGDIYFFEELRHDDECMLFFIDCTGHGVPGAFVTMLVKAVEQQIVAEIMSDKTNMDISPAWVMGYFNRELKKLLKQETKESISNAGWDGGIIYYNKKTQILKFAGAETPLFYTTKDGEFKTIKGNRYSVGYKKCSIDYEYKETILEVEEGMKFWCTTDGYLDQNGGEKDFPFGKKRFGNIIKEYHAETMADQQEVFLYEMAAYEEMIENNDRNDDMTVIGFEIGATFTTIDTMEKEQNERRENKRRKNG